MPSRRSCVAKYLAKRFISFSNPFGYFLIFVNQNLCHLHGNGPFAIVIAIFSATDNQFYVFESSV